MNDIQFRAALDWFMCSDPWPVSGRRNYKIMLTWFEFESRRRGYQTWVDAYHEMPRDGNDERRADNQ